MRKFTRWGNLAMEGVELSKVEAVACAGVFCAPLSHRNITNQYNDVT